MKQKIAKARRAMPAMVATLANFFHHLPDGTTAAERFFAKAPADLFEWLLAHVALPARPASSRLAT